MQRQGLPSRWATIQRIKSKSIFVKVTFTLWWVSTPERQRRRRRNDMNTFDTTTEPLTITWTPRYENLFTLKQIENLVSYATNHGKEPLDVLILFTAINERFNSYFVDEVEQSWVRPRCGIEGHPSGDVDHSPCERLHP